MPNDSAIAGFASLRLDALRCFLLRAFYASGGPDDDGTLPSGLSRWGMLSLASIDVEDHQPPVSFADKRTTLVKRKTDRKTQQAKTRPKVGILSFRLFVRCLRRAQKMVRDEL